jgi:hypothetical protein
MNILYKYCDQLGVVKILGALELKLPYISEVNDPLECLPFFYCPDDKAAIEKRYLSVLNRRNLPISANYRRKLDELFEAGEIQKTLAESSLKTQKNLNRKNCLLSVSKTARDTVMWAHYADKHKGVVIGIDFDKFFPKNGIKMYRVDYSEQRPEMNVLDNDEEEDVSVKYMKTLLTKSVEWRYEREFRVIFLDTYLMALEQQGLARLKELNGKKTWYLRLNPESIKEIIFGLYTEESLKLAIGKLIKQSELQHIKLYQAEESKTYILNLIEIENQQKRG